MTGGERKNPADIWDPAGPGYAVIPGSEITQSPYRPPIWHSYVDQTWENLSPDQYHRGSGYQVRYRAHEHIFVPAHCPEHMVLLPHLPFALDPAADNTYGGGFREFPGKIKYVSSAFMRSFIQKIQADYMRPLGDAIVTVVQFRTVAPADGTLLPISDGGPHQDGFDALTLSVVHRDDHAEGGLSQVYDLASGALQLESDLAEEPWTTIVFNDRTKLHHATEMRSTKSGSQAVRDILITDWQRAGNLLPSLKEIVRKDVRPDGWYPNPVGVRAKLGFLHSPPVNSHMAFEARNLQ